MFEICTLLLFLIVPTVQLCDSNFCNCINQTCASCLTNSMYLINSSCLPCPFQCSACTSQSLCTSCYGSYYLSNNNCLRCGKFCSVCNSSACLKCMVLLRVNRMATDFLPELAWPAPSPTLSVARAAICWSVVPAVIGKTEIAVRHAENFVWCAVVLQTVCNASRDIKWQSVSAATAPNVPTAAQPAPPLSAPPASITTISPTESA